MLALLCGRTIRFVNSSSHQALYGNRLTRAYLGASNSNRFIDASGQPAFRSDPRRQHRLGRVRARSAIGGPLHIVNVTLNETVLGASQVEQRDRKGLPMAVGPCGLSGGIESHALWKQRSRSRQPADARLDGASACTEHRLGQAAAPRTETTSICSRLRRSTQHQVEALNVGTWTAISGAAFSTGLGARTSLALSLLLGIANVRLGYWWDSHVKPGDRESARTSPTLRNRVGEQLNGLVPGADAPVPGVHGAVLSVPNRSAGI